MSLPPDRIWIRSPTSPSSTTISISLDPSSPKAGAKGGLKADAFWTGSAAHDANDRIIYNDDTGYLYYDRDGTGGAQQQAIAKLSKHLEITHKDFFIV